MPDTINETPWLEVFRSGRYPQGNVSAEEVRQIADAYDPSVLEAAASVDHEREGPAYGWVSDVKTEETEDVDGNAATSLFVKFRKMARGLYEQVFETENRPRRSIEILRDYAGQGKYLGAVSFLGVTPPAVAALEPVGQLAFSDEQNFERWAEYGALGDMMRQAREAEDLTIEEVAEAVDRDASTLGQIERGEIVDVPDDVLTAAADALGVPLEELRDARDSELPSEDDGDDEDDGSEEDPDEFAGDGPDVDAYAELQAENDRLEQKLQAIREDAARERVTAWANEHVPPRLRDDAQALLLSLESSADVMAFSHDTHETPADAFRGFVEEAMEFAEMFETYADGAPDPTDDTPNNTTELAAAIRESMAAQM